MAVGGRRQRHGARLARRIDEQRGRGALRRGMTMRIGVKAGRCGDACVEHGRSHQAMPEQRGPIVRTWPERPFVEQAVVAGGERVVHHYLDAGSGEAAELIEIAKAVEKGRVPGIAAAGGIRGLRQPDWLARLEFVAQAAIDGKRSVGPGEPVLGQRLCWTVMYAAAWRERVVMMIGDAIEPWPRRGEQITCVDAGGRLTGGARADDQCFR